MDWIEDIQDSKTSLRDKFASKEAEAAEATAKLEETQRSEDEDLDDFYEKWKNMSQEEQVRLNILHLSEHRCIFTR